MNDSNVHVADAVDRSALEALVDRVREEGITQVVLALEERRNALPLAELVRVQLVAVAAARARGLDPDRPRNLARSVILGTP